MQARTIILDELPESVHSSSPSLTMTTVTITLENELEQSLKELAAESGMTPDEAVRDALK